MTEYENIELCSEKVRNIIGRVPPELVTGGTAYVRLRTPMKYDIKLNMQGAATITIADRSILQYILGK